MTVKKTPHAPSGEFEHDIEQAALDARAAYLRGNRMTYQQIADEMGVSVSAAHARVQRALAAVPAESVQMLRAVELADLDWQAQRMRVIAMENHYHPARLYKGRPVGNPVIDRGPNIAALRELRHINESRRKLLGTDAPAELRVSVSEDWIAEIERLAIEVGLNDVEYAEVMS